MNGDLKFHTRIQEVLQILQLLGLPEKQQNERSALVLLALLDLNPERNWSQSKNPLLGVTPIMEWMKTFYGKNYASNTRETVRRQTLHQFLQAGLVLQNPDDETRPTNSSKTVYQIREEVFNLLRSYGSQRWALLLENYLSEHDSLVQKYAAERSQSRITLNTPEGRILNFSPGAHSDLICRILTVFLPQFLPQAEWIYAGDTGEKWAFWNKNRMTELGIVLDSHGKMPDVIAYDSQRKWFILVEAVTSHGPVDPKRKLELEELFHHAPGMVFVTAFPDRSLLKRYSSEIAWETEVWVADNPTHMIHFNGTRFLGPYTE